MNIKGHEFRLYIHRKKIKNLYLRLLNDSLIVVTCPEHTTDSEVERFVLDNSDKIIERYHNLKKSKNGFNNPLYYLGEAYKLDIMAGRSKIEVGEDTITITVPKADLNKARALFYNEGVKALDVIIASFIPKYEAILKERGYTDKLEIKYHLLKRVWGVCYAEEGKIELNKRLIHYEPECIEAVFFHECAHLLIKDHSKKFRDFLKTYMPDYKERAKKLIWCSISDNWSLHFNP